MKYLDEMVDAVSRTFALSIKYLPPRLKSPVGLAYLLFRVADCIEDHPDIAAGEKSELLLIWKKVLQGGIEPQIFTRRIALLDGNLPDVSLAQHAPELIDYLNTFGEELRGLIVAKCADSALGMANWQQKGPFIDTELQLDDYMHQVAGLVGYLITEIYAWYYPVVARKKDYLLPISHEIGLGLQSVNVIRGLRSDYKRGWMFVPKEYLDKVGITREQFFQREHESSALLAVEMLATKAEKHLRHGLQYIGAFPRYLFRPRLANIWPLFFAIKTLSASRNNPEIVRSEVKISREDVKHIQRTTILWGWSNRWLKNYYGSLARAFLQK